MLPKLILIVGPTASGKTGLGIALARKFNGEIINADSRQIYKEMDIATAKPTRDLDVKKKKTYVVEGIVHHLVGIVKPSQEFTMADFKMRANEAIADIISRGKLPIVVGGTGLYIWALVDNLDIPKVAPNKKLREGFEIKTLPELVSLIKKIDPQTAEKIDLKNKRRVLRALEVAITSGESFSAQTTKSAPIYDCLQIGLNWPREQLYTNISNRIDKQLAAGLIEETTALAKRYNWKLPSMSSIGYKQIGAYLRKEMTLEQAVEMFKRDTRRYAKRQISWFKRDKRIQWIENDSLSAATVLIEDFIL